MAIKVGDIVYLWNSPDDKWRVQATIGYPVKKLECKNKKTGRLCIGNIDDFRKDGEKEDPADSGAYGFYTSPENWYDREFEDD